MAKFRREPSMESQPENSCHRVGSRDRQTNARPSLVAEPGQAQGICRQSPANRLGAGTVHLFGKQKRALWSIARTTQRASRCAAAPGLLEYRPTLARRRGGKEPMTDSALSLRLSVDYPGKSGVIRDLSLEISH